MVTVTIEFATVDEVKRQDVRSRARSLGRLAHKAEVAANVELRAVGQLDVAADVEQVQVAADVDVRSRERDSVEHVERVHVAAGRDRGAGQDRVEGDPVDWRRAAGDQRTGQNGRPGNPRYQPIWPRVDGDLADIEDVAQIRRAVGETVGEALLLCLPERVDRQLGILGRAIDDDADAAARHGVGSDGADRLRIGRGCLGNQCCGSRGR